MKVEKNKMVTVTYELKLDGKDGNVVEVSGKNAPLEFAYGIGMLLPAFEDGLKDKEIGDKFEIEINAENGYGQHFEEMIVNVPKNIFEIDGKIDYDMIAIGNALPMMSTTGEQMTGVVKNIDDEHVTMDFNHPLAGKDLYFSGEVVNVREATESELEHFYDHEDCCEGHCTGCDGECDDECDEYEE